MTFSSKIKDAREIAQKTGDIHRGNAWYGEYCVNYFSIYISYSLWKLGVTANAVTVVMGIVGIIGSACIVFDNLWLTITGTVLWHLWFVLDCVDGEVARLRRQTSMLGIYLDDLSHIIVNSTFGLALGIHVCLKDFSVFTVFAAFVLYSACHWWRGIRHIVKRTLTVKRGGEMLERPTGFDKKSIRAWLRLLIVQSFGPIGQMFIIPAVIILDYAVKPDIAKPFLYLYTTLFLGYLVALTLRDACFVHQKDLSSRAENTS